MAGFQGNQYIDNGGHTNTFITGHDEMRYGPIDQNQPGQMVLYDQTRTVEQHIETRPIQEGAIYGQAHMFPDQTDQDGMASIALVNDLQEGNGAQSASPQPALMKCPSSSPISEGHTFVRGQATPVHDCGPNMQSVSGFSDYGMNKPSGGHLRELPIGLCDRFSPYLQDGTLEMSGSSQPRPEVSDREDEYGRTTTTLGDITSSDMGPRSAATNYVTAQQPATRQISQLPAQLNSQLSAQLNSQLPAQLTGGVLRKWKRNDDPVRENEHWNPSCLFIRKLERKRCETAVKTPVRALEQRMQDPCIGGQEKFKRLVDMGFKKENILRVAEKIGWKAPLEVFVDILLKQSSGLDCSNRRTETPRERDPSICRVCKRRPVCVSLIPCCHIVCAQCARERDLNGYYWCGVCSKKVIGNTAFDSNIFFQ